MPELDELKSDELKTLWAKTLGELPDDEQFYLWTNLHTAEVVRQAILKTAGKNLQLGKTMAAEHKVRFASKVMLTLSDRRIAERPQSGSPPSGDDLQGGRPD